MVYQYIYIALAEINTNENGDLIDSYTFSCGRRVSLTL